MKTLPTWRYIARLARYAPQLYLPHAALWSVVHASPLLLGLIARSFFDALTGDARLPVSTVGLIVLYVIVAVSRGLLYLIAGIFEILCRFTMSGLLRRNLLRHVLERPGADALPFSIGEIISRFRDDAHEPEDNLDWTSDILGTGLFAVGAFLILLHVNVRMTLVTILPLLVVVAGQRCTGPLPCGQ